MLCGSFSSRLLNFFMVQPRDDSCRRRRFLVPVLMNKKCCERVLYTKQRARTQKNDERHFFQVHFIYMNVTPSLVGSTRLRLFSMYKRLFYIVKDELKERKCQGQSVGVFIKEEAAKKNKKRGRS